MAPLASSVHPSSQHIARLRKPELLLRMLLIRNSGFTEAINQAKQNNGTRDASSNHRTRTSEAYYMALNYTALESNRCMRPNAGSTRGCVPMG